MPREDLIEYVGEVQEALGGGQYSIIVEGNDEPLRARLSGKMKQNRIRVLPGDRVRLGVSPYDKTHGIITFRFRS